MVEILKLLQVSSPKSPSLLQNRLKPSPLSRPLFLYLKVYIDLGFWGQFWNKTTKKLCFRTKLAGGEIILAAARFLEKLNF